MCRVRAPLGLLVIGSVGYLVGLWQGTMLCGRSEPQEFSDESLLNATPSDTSDVVRENQAHKEALASPQDLGVDGFNVSKSYMAEVSSEVLDDSGKSNSLTDVDNALKGGARHKDSSKPKKVKSEGAETKQKSQNKECRKFEDISFPLDGWPASVRAVGGQSIYGTGWAQQFLRRHQFPEKCSGKAFVEHGMFKAGMGSNMHIGATVLAFALNHNMIYLWPEDDKHNPWTLGSSNSSNKSVADCPTGRATRSYECYLKPISSCKGNGKGPKFTGVARERGDFKITSTDSCMYSAPMFYVFKLHYFFYWKNMEKLKPLGFPRFGGCF